MGVQANRKTKSGEVLIELIKPTIESERSFTDSGPRARSAILTGDSGRRGDSGAGQGGVKHDYANYPPGLRGGDSKLRKKCLKLRSAAQRGRKSDRDLAIRSTEYRTAKKSLGRAIKSSKCRCWDRQVHHWSYPGGSEGCQEHREGKPLLSTRVPLGDA